jgi:hypothetical protein
MALTTHFAQVQFRLRQIIASPNEDKEVCNLLCNLDQNQLNKNNNNI